MAIIFLIKGGKALLANTYHSNIHGDVVPAYKLWIYDDDFWLFLQILYCIEFKDFAAIIGSSR